jgi:hypothetical protein
VVPIEPAGGAPAAPPAPPQSPVIALFAPGTEFQSGAPTPYTVPITVQNLPEVSIITVKVTYNPAVLRAVAAVQGTFMNQGNVGSSFVPKIDTNAGTVDLVFSRPGNVTGASGTNLLGSIQFQALAPGSATLTLTGSATAPGGAAVPVQFGNVTVVVK